MTRETKVGLVVAGAFLCLVCIVVVSKIGRASAPPDDTSDPNHRVAAVDPEKDTKKPIEPVKVEPAKAPKEVKPGDRIDALLNHIENTPNSDRTGMHNALPRLPQGSPLPAAPMAVSPAVVEVDPKKKDAPPSAIDFPPLTPTVVVDEPGKPGVVAVSEPTKPTFPPVAEPVKPTFPPVAEPVKPTFPPVAEPVKPTFPPVAEPVKPTFPPVAEPVKPTFPPVAEPVKPTFPPVAEPVKPPTIPAPPALKPGFTNQTVPLDGTVTVPMIPPPSNGFKDVPITSVPTIPKPETQTVKISAPKPPVTVTVPERVEVKLGESTFAALSKRFYGDEKYAKALQAYNRAHSGGVVNGDNLLQTPPRLNPGQQVIQPPRGILERDYRGLIDVAEQPPTIPPVSVAPPVNLSRPVPPSITTGPMTTTPLTINTPTSDRTRSYVVANPAGERLRDIAERLLGDASRWPAIYRLNNVQPQFPIPAGTKLQVPVN